MSISSRLFRTATIACVLAVVLAISANAIEVASRSDHLIGYGTVGDLLLNSVVDYDAGTGVYTYDYTLQYITGSAVLHVVSVENPEALEFQEQWNSGNFQDLGFYEGNTEVLWYDGTLEQGGTRYFRYKSYFGWRDIPVTAYVQNDSDSAAGFTLGMQSSVPEPSSLMGLALAFGVVPVFLRRRK